LGVVFLLFVIGLELQPARLWALRKSIFGYGTAQLSLSAVALAALGIAFGVSLPTAIIVGLALSLSSTAFALQLLAERRELPTRHGRLAFAILLFQDLAAIPIIALIPLLAFVPATDVDPGSGISAVAIARAIGVIALVIVGGRLLLRPFFRLVLASGIHELTTAAALLVVLGTALLVHYAGLSMALGAFLAGVLLADSEYRHELQADIEPFRGLLLGLFFISVGMSVDVGLVGDRPATIVALVLLLLLVKGAVLWGLARFSGQGGRCAVNLALYLAQGGEFAFVVLGLAARSYVVDRALADLLIAVVSLSMALTPLLLALRGVLGRQRADAARAYDRIDAGDNRVIIAGFGRFGQVVARMLRMKKIPFTALESSFEQVAFVRRFGNKIYFGDASRLELLHAANADKAEVFVLAIDDVEASLKTVEIVKRHYPHLKIYARARNRHHAYRLMDLGVTQIERETFLSSVQLAQGVLHALGVPMADAAVAAARFRAHDEDLLRRQHAIHHDEERVIATAREAAAELERVFEQDTAVGENK
jgi:glutathione-regulated potassium-efflux system ancillary protein KefC/glutathione-regulated potassium-efflux system protein KefB